MIETAQRVLQGMRLPSGLYVASLSEAYQYVWLRDTCYASWADFHATDGRYEQTYHALLDIFKRYLWKIQFHAGQRPIESYEYIHPRYSVDGYELDQPWGNAQNDATGAFLFGIGEGLRLGKRMLRDDADRQVIQLLATYLGNLQYWQDADNGMWEENREVHASSIGACTAGLIAVQPYVFVDWQWIRLGLQALFTLFPHESVTKDCDLAQLSLIYPYRLLPADLARRLIARVEDNLLRDVGVIRYQGDHYFAEDSCEPEWTLGLAWLGLASYTVGDWQKAWRYLDWTQRVMSSPGVLPELYLGRSRQPNGNTPLAWAVAMYIVLGRSLVGSMRGGMVSA